MGYPLSTETDARTGLWSGITGGRLPSSMLTSCPVLHRILILCGWYPHGQQSWTRLRFTNKHNGNTQTLQVKTISRTSYANKSPTAWTTRLHPDQNPFLKLQSTELPTWRDLCKQDVQRRGCKNDNYHTIQVLTMPRCCSDPSASVTTNELSLFSNLNLVTSLLKQASNPVARNLNKYWKGCGIT